MRMILRENEGPHLRAGDAEDAGKDLLRPRFGEADVKAVVLERPHLGAAHVVAYANDRDFGLFHELIELHHPPSVP